MKIYKIATIIVLLALFVVICTNVYADISTSFPSGSSAIPNIDTSAKKIWKTVTDIVQMVAFGAIIFAGVRYMLASADQKADIKKGLAMLVIGAILVFAASTVVEFVVTAGEEILPSSTTATTTTQ